MKQDITQTVMHLLNTSYSPYHAVNNIKTVLQKHGYEELEEKESWQLNKQGKYFVVRGGSSIVAFSLQDVEEKYGFNIVASHSDSPTFKIKPKAEQYYGSQYVTLNVEPYGGLIMSSWFDRPLTIAGKVVVKEDGKFKEKLVYIDEDLLVIPSLAIHQNRDVNTGFNINAQTMMCPLLASEKEKEEFIIKSLSKELDILSSDIYAHDLFLTPRTQAVLVGLDKEFIVSPKLDDLECAYTSLLAFMQSTNKHSINVFSCFDHEEIGSTSRNGAASTFLFDILERINKQLGYKKAQLHSAFSQSMIVSADNAHAVHPNFPEKADPTNKVFINQGVVIKYNANQSYTTDALSSAIIKYCFEKANVPYQEFTNRSDARGGGTLGSISSSQVSILSCDIGLPQLAMHSVVETAGTKDITYMVQVLTEFYQLNIKDIL